MGFNNENASSFEQMANEMEAQETVAETTETVAEEVAEEATETVVEEVVDNTETETV